MLPLPPLVGRGRPGWQVRCCMGHRAVHGGPLLFSEAEEHPGCLLCCRVALGIS